jgi:predicted GIY-YIG superfamily endonuclease
VSWTLYLLRSEARGSYYAGIARDPERRLLQHNGELPGGAKATRAGRPWTCVATWGPFEDRGAAQRAEHELKRLPGPERAAFRV